MLSEARILVVEDEYIVTLDLCKKLRQLGCHVLDTASNGIEAFDKFRTNKPSLLIMDIGLQGEMDGIDTVRKIQEFGNDIPVVYVTAYSDSETVERANQTNPVGYILKPFGAVELKKTLEMAIYKHDTEKRLKESERKYRTLFDCAHDAIILLKGNQFYDCNEKSVELFGCSRSELSEHVLEDFTPPVQPDGTPSANMFKERVATAMTGTPQYFEWRIVRPDSRVFETSVSFNRVDVGGEPLVQAIVRDITEHKRAEMALRESEERFRSVSEITSDFAFCLGLGQGGRFRLEWEVGAFARISGYEPSELTDGGAWSSVLSLADKSAVLKRFKSFVASPRPDSLDFRIVTRDGRERWLNVYARPENDESAPGITRIIGAGRDITDRKSMEEEILNARRLESLGVLAGGIAHDFNNLLTGILGNISLARMMNRGAGSEGVNGILSDAENACSRAKDLTHQLLTFSKGGAPIKKTGSIAELVKVSATFALSGSRSQCRFHNPSDLRHVEMDEGQVSQVVHNLVLNADQSMPEGGIIDISAENLTLDRINPYALPTGHYVKVTIADHGIGIPPEHLAKIFDPYFTTKKKGSGLGLATSYSIVKRHQGYIGVTSDLGKGTRFSFCLPAVDLSPPGGSGEGVEDLPSGKGRVLVMDDEEMIRRLAKKLLENLGYAVEEASDGEEAVRLYGKAMSEGRPFKAVIVDLTIPGGMGGFEAMQALRVLDSGVRAIVSSGYSNDPIMADYGRHGFKGVISKPYTVGEIAKVLRLVSDV